MIAVAPAIANAVYNAIGNQAQGSTPEPRTGPAAPPKEQRSGGRYWPALKTMTGEMKMKQKIELQVNGKIHEVLVEPGRPSWRCCGKSWALPERSWAVTMAIVGPAP